VHIGVLPEFEQAGPARSSLLIWSELSISKFILNLALVLVLKFHGFVCVAKVERVAIE
jgi:hypothetical protein